MSNIVTLEEVQYEFRKTFNKFEYMISRHLLYGQDDIKIINEILNIIDNSIIETKYFFKLAVENKKFNIIGDVLKRYPHDDENSRMYTAEDTPIQLDYSSAIAELYDEGKIDLLILLFDTIDNEFGVYNVLIGHQLEQQIIEDGNFTLYEVLAKNKYIPNVDAKLYVNKKYDIIKLISGNNEESGGFMQALCAQYDLESMADELSQNLCKQTPLDFVEFAIINDFEITTLDAEFICKNKIVPIIDLFKKHNKIMHVLYADDYRARKCSESMNHMIAKYKFYEILEIISAHNLSSESIFDMNLLKHVSIEVAVKVVQRYMLRDPIYFSGAKLGGRRILTIQPIPLFCCLISGHATSKDIKWRFGGGYGCDFNKFLETNKSVISKYNNNTLWNFNHYSILSENNKKSILMMMLCVKQMKAQMKQIIPKPIICLIINMFVY